MWQTGCDALRPVLQAPERAHALASAGPHQGHSPDSRVLRDAPPSFLEKLGTQAPHGRPAQSVSRCGQAGEGPRRFSETASPGALMPTGQPWDRPAPSPP